MKIATALGSSVIEKAIHVIARTLGHEIVNDVEVADAIITNDLRLMLSCLKKDKRVVQFLVTPSEEPATGLMTSYPALFSACRVIEGKGVDGSEALIAFLLSNPSAKEPE